MVAKRSELIQRIEALSDEEMERVAPYIEADLDAADDLDALHAEIAEGRNSARSEALLDDEDVEKQALERLQRRP